VWEGAGALRAPKAALPRSRSLVSFRADQSSYAKSAAKSGKEAKRIGRGGAAAVLRQLRPHCAHARLIQSHRAFGRELLATAGAKSAASETRHQLPPMAT
jgi:hypothetical protein